MERTVEVSLLLDFYGKLLTDKQEEVLRQYFDEDSSLSEIALNAGVSRQAVHDIINRSEKKLRELEDTLQLMQQFRFVIDEMQSIKLQIVNLDTDNQDEKAAIVKQIDNLIEKWEE